ncbi:MAG: hypothetical protein R6U35_01805 [Candidatus Humimicrobiaceae bacterium]
MEKSIEVAAMENKEMLSGKELPPTPYAQEPHTEVHIAKLNACYVYIAQPPLYQVKNKKEVFYAYTDSELKKIRKKLKGQKLGVQQYKGLGEMDPEQLWETTMNPETRTLLKVEIEDALIADDTFSTLMGSKVEPRREFIQKNAKDVSFIDV